MTLTQTLVLIAVLCATITLLVELRSGATTLRCVVASSAVLLLPYLFFPAWLILRTVERRREQREL